MVTVTTIKKGYKQTELGIIPEDWEVKKLGNCLTRPPRYGIGAAAVEYSDRLPKYLRITDISEDGRYLPEKTVSVDNLFSSNYFLSEGDLVVARTGASVGKSYLYKPKDGPLVYAGFLICLSSDKNVLRPQYLDSYLKTTSYWNWVKVTSMRSGQPGINGKEYASLLVPLPKIAEQTAIATILSDTDALIEGLEKLITKKKVIKQGAMQQLLTGKKRLPGFSEKWSLINMAKHASLKARIGWQALTTEEYLDIGTYYLVTGTDFIGGRINWSTCHFVDEWRYRQDPNIQLKNGDVLLTKDGTIGKVGYVENLPSRATLNSGVFVIRPLREAFVSLYLYYVLTSKIFDEFISKITAGSTITHLYQKDFVSFEFLAPEIKEQVSIANILSDMDVEIRSLEQKRDKYTLLKQGMMQQLLTGKIRIHGKN